MIAVQTIRATSKAPAECAMSAWTSYNSTLKAMSLPVESVASAYLMSKKRKRDSFEAYDFQAHGMQQRMRYSLLREQPQDAPHPSSVHPRKSLEQLADSVVPVESPSIPSPPELVTDAPASKKRSSKSESIRKARRRKKSSSSKKSSTSSSSPHRRVMKMTRKNYHKKKRLEMMEATALQLRRILAATSVPHHPSPQLHCVLRRAEQLDLSLRGQCNSIVQKEQDIKSWLGMTTSNKSKIVSLRKRLHDRWSEVKDLQSVVKPKRQRLKNLRFAARCVEGSITEE